MEKKEQNNQTLTAEEKKMNAFRKLVERGKQQGNLSEQEIDTVIVEMDLDVDEIMLKLATALQMLSQKKNKRGEIKRKPTKKAGRMKQFFTPDLFIGIFVIVGIAGRLVLTAS